MNKRIAPKLEPGSKIVNTKAAKLEQASEMMAISKAVKLEPASRVVNSKAVKLEAASKIVNSKAVKLEDPGPSLVVEESKTSTKPTIKLPQSCQMCSDSFTLKSELKNHQEQCHSTSAKPKKRILESLQCYQCSQRFKKKERLEFHLENVHSKFGFSCIRCPMKFSNKSTLKKHISTEHPLSYQCEFCLQRYSLEHYLEKHKRIHIDQTSHCCLQCPARFISTDLLVRHECLVHSTKQKCPHCFELFPGDQIYQHQKGCLNIWAFPCIICQRAFKSKDSLETHNRLKHNLSEPYEHSDENPKPKRIRRPFDCLQCPSTFLSKKFLTDHETLVHCPKQKCTRCFKFYPEDEIYQHQNQCANIGPFTCLICQCYFKTSDSHIEHMTEEHYKVICEHCKELFGPNSISEHREICIHKGPFVCCQCSCDFKSKDSLLEHRLFCKYEDLPYQCPHCTDQFKSQDELIMHLASHIAEGEDLQTNLFNQLDYDNEADLNEDAEHESDCELPETNIKFEPASDESDCDLHESNMKLEPDSDDEPLIRIKKEPIDDAFIPNVSDMLQVEIKVEPVY